MHLGSPTGDGITGRAPSRRVAPRCASPTTIGWWRVYGDDRHGARRPPVWTTSRSILERRCSTPCSSGRGASVSSTSVVPRVVQRQHGACTERRLTTWWLSRGVDCRPHILVIQQRRRTHPQRQPVPADRGQRRAQRELDGQPRRRHQALNVSLVVNPATGNPRARRTRRHRRGAHRADRCASFRPCGAATLTLNLACSRISALAELLERAQDADFVAWRPGDRVPRSRTSSTAAPSGDRGR